MKLLCSALVIAALLLTAAGNTLWAADSGGSKRAGLVSTDQLRAMLGNPDVIIIDVRNAKEWETATKKIKGAIREDAYQVAQWAAKYPKDKTIALY